MWYLTSQWGLLKYQRLMQTEADVMNEPIGFCAEMCTFTFKIKWSNFHLLLRGATCKPSCMKARMLWHS